MIRMYCFGESGNAYKATLPLHLSGLEWTPVYVDFFGGEARTPEFRALNPMGEVPVMVDGDTTLTQSGAIQDYISERRPGSSEGKTRPKSGKSCVGSSGTITSFPRRPGWSGFS